MAVRRFVAIMPSTLLNAWLAEGAQPPQIGPADTDRPRADRKRLDDVAATPEAAVDQDRHAVADGLDDFRQHGDRRTDAVLSTRPPWLETTIPSMPASAASFASSDVRMPFSTSFTLTLSRRRLIVSHVRFVTAVPLTPPSSIPEKFRLRLR